MVITVTLNPAIDKTVTIEAFAVNQVNRIYATRLDAGGKGINVSKVIKNLGGQSRAIGLLAGKAGEFIKEYLDEAAIENDFVFVPGETRTNLKVVDPAKGTNTDINEPGPDITPENVQAVSQKLFQTLDGASVVVLSGSIPRKVAPTIYQQWIFEAKKRGAKTILDADGELLKYGLEAGPYLIKPNIHELERLIGRPIVGTDDTIAVVRELMQQYGIEMVALSMGEKGALFVNKEKAVLAHGIKVDVKSTVGAGDSMVAALAYSLDQGYTFEKAVTLAVAAGTANVMTDGTQPSTLSSILEMEKRVTFEYCNH